MQINVNYVLEKDIDLLFIEEMISNSSFRRVVLDHLDKGDLEIIEVYHSLTHPLLGESDITLVFKGGIGKYGLLVEDKIDAIAMPRQAERYIERGNNHIMEGLFDSFDAMIIAPKEYLMSNEEAKQYKFQLSYEEMITFFDRTNSRGNYKATILENAIEKKRKGYTPIEDEMVTLFWSKYYEFKNANYPNLKLKEVKGPRGRAAVWPGFNTDFKDARIMHKSDRGFLDLTLIGTADNYAFILEELKELIDDEMSILKISKSSVIRIEVPVIDFTKPFDEHIEDMFFVLEKVSKLNDFTRENNLQRFLG